MLTTSIWEVPVQISTLRSTVLNKTCTVLTGKYRNRSYHIISYHITPQPYPSTSFLSYFSLIIPSVTWCHIFRTISVINNLHLNKASLNYHSTSIGRSNPERTPHHPAPTCTIRVRSRGVLTAKPRLQFRVTSYGRVKGFSIYVSC